MPSPITSVMAPTIPPLHTRNQKLSYRRPGKPAGAVHIAGDPETLGGFRGYVLDMLAWMAACAFSPMSIKARRIELG